MHPSSSRAAPPPHEEEARPVGWIELFYDLVMVAAVIVFSSKVSANFSTRIVIWFVFVFAMLWWMWLSTTFVLNVERVEDTALEVIVALEMFAITMMTIFVADYHHSDRSLVSPSYALVVACVALLNEWLRRRGPVATRGYARRRRDVYLVSAALWALGGVVPSPWHAIAWVLAAVVMLLPLTLPGLNTGVQVPAVDTEHLGERFALLTMLVMGESFVKVALTASAVPARELNFVVLPLEIAVIFALWLAYFLDVASSGLPTGLVARRAWILAHLVLAIGLVGLAVGLGHFITLQELRDLKEQDGYLLAVPLSLIFVAIATMIATVRGRTSLRVVRTYGIGAVAAILAAILISEGRVLTINQSAALLCGITLVTSLIAHRQVRRIDATSAVG